MSEKKNSEVEPEEGEEQFDDEDIEKGEVEGKESFATEVHLPMRILSCTKCAATLLWGLEVCPRCAGEASQMPWMSGKKR